MVRNMVHLETFLARLCASEPDVVRDIARLETFLARPCASEPDVVRGIECHEDAKSRRKRAGFR